MPTVTVTTIIAEAMRSIGACAVDEDPAPSELSVGLTRLNFMLDLWSTQSLIVRGPTTAPFTLVTGTSSYTIGTGGVFNTTKPLKVLDSCYVRDVGGNDSSVEVISADEYDDIEDKSYATGTPENIYYDPGATQGSTLGTVHLYPIPDEAYTLYLAQMKALTEFTTVTDTVTLESMYLEALVNNLAVRLWFVYHDRKEPIPPDIKLFATKSLRALDSVNDQKVFSRTDIPSSGRGGYSIYSDTFGEGDE